MKSKIFCIPLFLFLVSCSNDKNIGMFKIHSIQQKNGNSIYQMLDEDDKLIKELDTSKYTIFFNEDQLTYFAITSKSR